MATLELRWVDSSTYTLRSLDDSLKGTQSRVYNVALKKGRIYHAHLRNSEQAPAQEIVLKVARGADELIKIDHEYQLYCEELKDLQGKTVPKCYGFFKGDVGGVGMGCLLLERCTPQNDNATNDTPELCRQIMVATCHLHQAGVCHGNLSDGHHLLPMGKRVCVIDFSRAFLHQCPSGIPTLRGGPKDQLTSACPELAFMEKAYGIRSDGNEVKQRLSWKLW